MTRSDLVNYSVSYVTETYAIAESLYNGLYICYEITNGYKSMHSTQSCFCPLSIQISSFNLFEISRLSGLFKVSKLNDVVLQYAYDIGYSGFEEDLNVVLKVSGGRYTLSASFGGRERSVSVKMTDGMVSKISVNWKIFEDGYDYEISPDIEISYDYKSSLA